MVENPRREDFERCLREKFRVAAETPEPIELELVEVVVPPIDVPGYERFSLFFRGPARYKIEQQTVPLEHETLGRQDLFLVPVAQEPEGFRYEAVFNRPSADR
jgi:hypothetical protein